MILTLGCRLFRSVIVIGGGFVLSGCYYMQAVRGQLDVMNRSAPIESVIASAETPENLKERLRLVAEARQFSVDELQLPDNDSYKSYADLERNYVVWNVVAAPEFSLTPKQWCFPVAGCVSYRGYFSEDAATRKAAQFRRDGFDVAVGGVAAYSTLGKFSDPVLNTMMHWEDVDLVAVVFHELAHQQLYVKGDSGFNESFASAVEEIGVERWLKSRRSEDQFDAYRERRQLRQRLNDLMVPARAELLETYASDIDVAVMRKQKRQKLDLLADALKLEFERSGREFPTWLQEPLNNARLASMALYQDRLPEFRALMANCNDDIQCFYFAAEELADE